MNGRGAAPELFDTLPFERDWWCRVCARFVDDVSAPDGRPRHVVCGERVRLEKIDRGGGS